MTKPPLFELDAAVAVAAQRSFRGAARELGMSPSAVSHAIASLEQRLGIRLFHRSTRHVSPTEAGAAFLERVQPALGEIGDAVAAVGALRVQPSGTLRLNMSEGAAQMLMDPIILPYLARYPDMRVDLVTEGRLVDIAAGGFDAGVRQGMLVAPDMIAVACSDPIRFVVAGAPAYFARHGEPRTPQDLYRHVCIRARLPQGGALYDWEFERDGERQRITPQGPLTLDSHHLILAAALQGTGLIWANAWELTAHVQRGALRTVLQDWSVPEPPLALYYPSRRHLGAGMRALLALVRERYPAAGMGVGSSAAA